MLHINSLLRSHLASLFLSLALIVCFVSAARAQSALDGFDPNADWFVRVVVAQPDGKSIIGGEFTGVKGIPRNRIARLNPDGTLDNAFNPNADGNVWSMALQADGKILVGGDFTSIGGQARNRIARLDPVTGLADSFNPNANGIVHVITVQADGKILVGGAFSGASSIGGQTRNRIARLDATTGTADSFNPDAGGFGAFDPTVYAITVLADGRILVGGGFTAIGGQPRNRIARLDATTGAADSFNPDAGATFGISVQEIAVQPDGKFLVGGGFLNIGGQARNCVARLDPVTGAADSWNPNADNTVYALALQPDGKVLIGGDFGTVGGMTTFMARLDPVTGAPETTFTPGFNERVVAIAVQPDGKIVAGGFYTTVSGQTRNRIARLEANGSLDRTLEPGISGSAVYATAIQPDGKILIGGNFSNVLGFPRNNIARFNTDGSVDASFNPNANGNVYSIALQADGKILVGGAFTAIGGQTRSRLARLDASIGSADAFDPAPSSSTILVYVYAIALQADGKILVAGSFSSIGGQSRNCIGRLDTTGLADSFNPNANNVVTSIAVQPDGKILASGTFFNIGGQARNGIARLDAVTGLVDSFNASSNNSVYSIAIQPDGKILVGGYFTTIGGQPRIRMARLDGTTGLADSLNPAANDGVHSIAVQTDGKISAGGDFTSIGGLGRSHIARLDATTGLADSFDPNADFVVFSIAVQTDGKILAGGAFFTIGGQLSLYLARLKNDIAALQNLAVTQTSVTWTRGGSSPQLSRVTFESSTDNVNYTPLGNGTATGSNWILTGLSLPTGQNIYIRARGFYRSGLYNGSESITESVRNAFLVVGPTATPTNTATNTPTNTPTSTSTPTPTPTGSGTPSISGTITYGNAIGSPAPPRFVKNVSLSSMAGSPPVGPVITGTPGTYALTGFGAGSYTIKPTKPGGATTAITSNDAARVAQGVTGSLPFVSQNQRFAADVSGNGGVSSQDAAKIAQFVAGLPFSPPNITGQWKFFVTGAPSPLPTPPQVYDDGRSYASVTTSLTGEDFVGILVGEVSGNWNPATHPRGVENGKWKVESEDASAAEKLISVGVQDVVAARGKEIVIPVSVEGVFDRDVISYEFDLRYDPAVIQPMEIAADLERTASRGLSVVTNPNEPGLLRVVVYGAYPIDEDGVLLNLRFVAVGVVGSVSAVSFERVMFNEGDLPMTVTDGRLEVR